MQVLPLRCNLTTYTDVEPRLRHIEVLCNVPKDVNSSAVGKALPLVSEVMTLAQKTSLIQGDKGQRETV
jgi:hypothetical protein